MPYIYDNDLQFLNNSDNKYLEILHEYITKDSKGSPRFGISLIKTSLYKENFPNHKVYWKELIAELQEFGGNSFANIFRGGKGVCYKEILLDVCKKLKIKTYKHYPIESIENSLLENFLGDILGQMSESEIIDLTQKLNINNTQSIKFATSKKELINGIKMIFEKDTIEAYELAALIANGMAKNLTGKGLNIPIGSTVAKAGILIFGPLGWLISGTWSAIDIAEIGRAHV